VPPASRFRSQAAALAATFERAPCGVALLDADGRVERVNPALAGMLGRRAEELVGKRWGDVVCRPARFAAPGGELDGEFRAPRPDGSEVRLDVTASALPEFGRVVAYCHDISAERAREAQLKADRARLGALTEAVPDAVVILDAGGAIASWNRGAQAMFGLTPGEAIGRSFEDALVPEADRAAFRRVWRDLGYGRARSLRTGALRADGSIFPAQTSAAALADGGTLTGAVTVIRDISDMVDAQHELERSNADLERFAYAASHDLQEPLRSIEMGAESLMLAASERLDDDERGLLDGVVRSAARMTAQVQALMQLARLALDHVPDAVTPIGDALRDAREALRVALAEAGAELVVEGLLPAVAMPRAELALVLQNLIGNAIKFRRPGVPPRVVIAARADGPTVELQVADNGVGLSPEAEARIFGLFERDSSGVPGTGVGLAVCRHILERRGGTIAVSSAGPGTGAEFTLRMPAARPA
jgi:PAS domain S-box-containing protein